MNNIYAEIIKYAEKHNANILENRRTITPDVYVMLDSNGKYITFEVLDKKNKITKSAPTIGSLARVAQRPDIVVEKAMYVFGLKDEKKVTTVKYNSWVQMMTTNIETVPSLSIVSKFIKKFDEDTTFKEFILKEIENSKISNKHFISFKIDGVPLEDFTDWDTWLVDLINSIKGVDTATTTENSNNQIYSIISGTLQEPGPIQNCPQILNVPNDIKGAFGIGAGIYTVAMKEAAYESYGFVKAQGSNVGFEDEKKLAAGLELLLNDRKHNNKDFNLIWLYDNDTENLISEMFELNFDDIEEETVEDYANKYHNGKVAEIYSSVINGTPFTHEISDLDYHFIIGQLTVPSQGRFNINKVSAGSYLDLVTNLQKWYEDTKITTIVNGAENPKCIYKPYQILFNCISSLDATDKSKAIKAQFGNNKTEIIKSMLFGYQLPYVYYKRALTHTIKAIKSNNTIRTIWLQIMKCYLVRKGYNIMDSVMSNSNNVAFECGRLFATIEQMQWKSNDGNALNKSLAERYFSMYLTKPIDTFVKLRSNLTVYDSKLRRKGSVSTANYFSNLVSEICDNIGRIFPETFTEDEKSSCILGYYHQKNEFFKKHNTVNDSVENVEV